MVTIIVSDSLSVELYDSIKEYPVSLMLEAKQYGILQSGLATTPLELAQRKERMDLLLRFQQHEEYNLEAYNYELAQRLMNGESNFQELEWGCYLRSINDKPLTDYSEDALTRHLVRLKGEGLSSIQIGESLDALRDSMHTEMKRYYPRRLASGRLNNLARYLRYGLALIGHIEMDCEQTQIELDQATLNMLTIQQSLNFKDGPENVLVNLEKSQFKLYTTLQENGCMEPDKLTMYQFYGWIEVLEEKQEAHLQSLKAQTNASKRR